MQVGENAPFSRNYHVGGEPPPLSRVVKGDHHAVCNVRVRFQCRSDFRWLDSKPANLYLLVDPSKVFQYAFRPQRTRSPVRYKRAPGVSENGWAGTLLR